MTKKKVSETRNPETMSESNVKYLVPTEEKYLDWSNSVEIIQKAYKAKTFVMIIGSKGTGKKALVRHFAGKMNTIALFSSGFWKT